MRCRQVIFHRRVEGAQGAGKVHLKEHIRRKWGGASMCRDNSPSRESRRWPRARTGFPYTRMTHTTVFAIASLTPKMTNGTVLKMARMTHTTVPTMAFLTPQGTNGTVPTIVSLTPKVTHGTVLIMACLTPKSDTNNCPQNGKGDTHYCPHNGFSDTKVIHGTVLTILGQVTLRWHVTGGAWNCPHIVWSGDT